MLSTFYQKKQFRSFISQNNTVHHISSQCTFRVMDFGDQIDNLSSNYLHHPQSVIAQHGTLPEECQRRLCGLTGSS